MKKFSFDNDSLFQVIQQCFCLCSHLYSFYHLVCKLSLKEHSFLSISKSFFSLLEEIANSGNILF